MTYTVVNQKQLLLITFNKIFVLKSYKFFISEVNENKKSLGYGLIRDKTI